MRPHHSGLTSAIQYLEDNGGDVSGVMVSLVNMAGTREVKKRCRVPRRARQQQGSSPRFAELWASGEVGSPQDQSRHKIIDHPDVGLIALDCDALIVAGDDLRITVYTAEPGTQDAERLALAIVLGTQALID
jgi:hypothetical protein